MANYRSLVGGFFSSTPYDTSRPRTIRCNNPWALNVSEWQKSYPGFVGQTAPDGSANANKTSIYETPEQGVAAGWDLLRRYAGGGHDTVGEIINRYGGGQDYSRYLNFVLDKTGFTEDTSINLNNDAQLLKLAKAMFRYEAGQAPPWTDQQILYGFKLGRQYAGGPAARPAAPSPQVPTATTTTQIMPVGFWAGLFGLLAKLFRPSGLKVRTSRILRRGSTSPKGGDVWQLQERLRELGFVDLVVDGDYGIATERAVRTFQEAQNIDPDGEVGPITIEALNRTVPGTGHKPPLSPPPLTQGGAILTRPAWYQEAEKDIGWKEQPGNRGITYFIKDTNPRNGKEGDPYCAIGVNAWFGRAGLLGSGSAAARSFERSPNFVKLDQPALGCVVTMWRQSRESGLGHVFLYDGESDKGIRGIGANEDNMVKRSFHDRSRVTGYFWPKSQPLPRTGRIPVSDLTTVVNRSEI